MVSAITHTPASGPAELVTVPTIASFIICVALVLKSEAARNAQTPSKMIRGDRILVILSDLSLPVLCRLADNIRLTDFRDNPPARFHVA